MLGSVGILMDLCCMGPGSPSAPQASLLSSPLQMEIWLDTAVGDHRIGAGPLLLLRRGRHRACRSRFDGSVCGFPGFEGVRQGRECLTNMLITLDSSWYDVVEIIEGIISCVVLLLIFLGIFFPEVGDLLDQSID